MEEPEQDEIGTEEADFYCDELPPGAWVGFGRTGFPEESWKFLKDGTLQTLEGGEPIDLVTIDEYGDFELDLEWRIALGAESGVLYRVSPSAQEPWQSGPEMQVVDDLGHPKGRTPETSAGAVYGLIAPTDKLLRPAGTFNSSRITAKGTVVQHWLNGRKVVEYDTASKAFADLVAKSRFKDYASFGREAKGRIVLQHHGAKVWFRGIRIRSLSEEPGEPVEEGQAGDH